MKTQRRSSKIGPLAVCLLALVALALLILLVVSLLGSHSDAPQPPAVPLAVELDEPWENWFLTPHTTEEQQAYLAQTLDSAQRSGANLVLLTGRAGGGCLFRTRDKALPTLETVRANDRPLHKKFDPLDCLLDAAAQRGMAVALLATEEGGNPLAADRLDQLAPAVAACAKKRDLVVFAPKVHPVDALGQIHAYTDGRGTVLLRADGQPGLLAAASMQAPTAGAVLGSWSSLARDDIDARLYCAFREQEPAAPLLEQPVEKNLAVAYPADGAVLYGERVFLMGTSDPGRTLTVNGQEVQRQGSAGVWGVLMELAEGANTVTASQGGQSVQLTVTRRTGSWTPAKPVSDGSAPAQRGQKVQITDPLASVLETPGNPDSIAMTAYEGAMAQVTRSLPLTLNGKKTYAYQLHSGHYVLAKNCRLVDAPDAVFTGLAVQTLDNGDQVLRFEGEGTPLYYHSWQDNTLTLRFLSAEFTGQWPQDTGFVQKLEPSAEPGGFAVKLTFADSDPLWGYHVDYVDGCTRIYLKRAPRLSDADTGPLTGVTVLLDPGHGADDAGAMGCAGPDAPQEKDVNLALAQAAAHRLEQLGAGVVLTRTDDTYYTLGQRVQLLNTTKPDLFISVHHNSAELNQDMNQNGGVEAYWFYTEGKDLARNLVESIGQATGRVQRGVFYNYFYVTRSNICPAVLLETGFMTVPAEYEQVTDEAVLWAEAGAIAQAVVRSIPQ